MCFFISIKRTEYDVERGKECVWKREREREREGKKQNRKKECMRKREVTKRQRESKRQRKDLIMLLLLSGEW